MTSSSTGTFIFSPFRTTLAVGEDRMDSLSSFNFARISKKILKQILQRKISTNKNCEMGARAIKRANAAIKHSRLKKVQRLPRKILR